MSPDTVAAVLNEPLAVTLTEAGAAVGALFTGDAALHQAIESDAEWLWLLGPGLQPESGALGHLLQGARPSSDPVASVVAGMVLDASDHPVVDWLPGPQHSDSAAIMRLVEQRLLPIRHATFTNCLVRRTCFQRYGPPDTLRFGSNAARAWTAAVMRREPGYFAPLSIARPAGQVPGLGPTDSLVAARGVLRMTRAGSLTKGEALRMLLSVATHSGRWRLR